MKKISMFLLALMLSATGFSQQQLTTDQLVKNQLPANFRNNLPVFVKWLDEDNVILRMAVAPDSIVTNYVLEGAVGRDLTSF
jgi:hypothetical protein